MKKRASTDTLDEDDTLDGLKAPVASSTNDMRRTDMKT